MIEAIIILGCQQAVSGLMRPKRRGMRGLQFVWTVDTGLLVPHHVPSHKCFLNFQFINSLQ